jgi:murein L,D-transpeptidase YcbB/YkuD
MARHPAQVKTRKRPNHRDKERPEMTRLHLVKTPGDGRREVAFAARPALHARIVQQHLAALGLIEWGHVTGRFDAVTEAAVARFQATAGLPADGVPDGRTSDRLLEVGSVTDAA